jgi:amidohydrolase family protein
VIENCAIATMDGPRHDQGGTEYRSGHVTVTGDRITAVGEGPAGSVPDGARRIDADGCLASPGLVNTHHHLYQWLTQGRAQQSVLFDWLTELYPVWARIDAGQVHAAATAGLAWLALSGCTTSTDHHYIFPREALRGDGDADALAAEVAAAVGSTTRLPAAGPAAWAGTTRPARCGQACWPISRCGGSTASRTTRSRTAPAATRSRPWCSGHPPRLSCSWSAARRRRTAANCAPSTPPQPPARSGRPGFGWSAPS